MKRARSKKLTLGPRPTKKQQQAIAVEKARRELLERKDERAKRKLDPYYLSPLSIPLNLAYQWTRSSEKDDAEDNGWRSVPFTRHNFSRRHKVRNTIVVDGLILMEKAAAAVKVELADARAKAQKQHDDHPANGGRRGFILAPSFVVSSDYKGVSGDAPPLVVPVTITLQVNARWQDAAASLGLTVAEYARRRLIVYSHGETPAMLLPIDNPTIPVDEMIPLEMIESQNLTLKVER